MLWVMANLGKRADSGARKCEACIMSTTTVEKPKAKKSSKNSTSRDIIVTVNHVNNALAFTDEVCTTYPDRLGGTCSCNDAGLRIMQAFEKTCDEGTVKRESFTCHPRSFLKHIRPVVIIYLASVVAMFLDKPLYALAGLTLNLIVFSSQVVFYWKLFDFLFPKETGYNIFGTVDPEGEVKQQIVLCGHHDASYVFHYMDKSPKYYPLMLAAGITPFVLGVVFAIIMNATGIAYPWMKIAMALGALGVIPLWWFTTDTVSPGAGDNMIAVALANEGTRLFSDLKKQGKNPLKHTRLVCLTVDFEEAGLRGSMAYTKRHKKELTETKTYAFCMDTIFNADKLNFFNRDLNLTVKCSDQMANECTEIAKDLGYGARVNKMPFGGGSTDAAAFAKAGIEATCLLAFELNVSNLQDDLVYHTPADTAEAIEPLVVEQCLNVIKEYVLKKDREAR